MRIASALGLSSFTLLLASAAITLFSMQGVSDLYATDKSGASILLRTLTLVSNYLGSIRVVAFGVAVIIFSWVALQMPIYSRFLNWLGVVSGILTFGFLITPLAVVGYVSYLLMAIWAIWLNRFTPPNGAYPITLNSIQVAWPTVTPAVTPDPIIGRTARLVVYQDTDGDGDPSNATLLASLSAPINTVSGFQSYPVNITVPGPGDIYIGFEDLWAENGYSPRLYPASLDTTPPSRGRSWLAAMANGSPPNVNNLGANTVLETIDAAGLPGNFMIRATGSTGQTACPPSPTPTSTPAGCQPSFADVNPGDYFYQAVVYLYCHGAISGYADGYFRPYNNTTRGQLSKIVVLGEGWPVQTPTLPTFVDVPPGSPFFPYVETAYSHSIISGYSCGPGCLAFLPGNDVTRGQLCKIIVLAQDWPITPPGQPTFQDVPTRNTFYGYIETAYAHSIISGYSCGVDCLEFHPGANATRGQICKIVYNAITGP